MAELGEAGEAFEAELELKLLADIGLVGFPNAGKSTFLSVVSNARPEIADYAFTTLTPNLGVADIDDTSLLIADIPGLIEGASQGKGLGDAFLRHVERTSVLLHLIDVYNDDVAKAYRTIRLELASYSPELLSRPEVVALTKTEGVDSEIIGMQMRALRSAVDSETEIVAISSQSHEGIKTTLRLLAKLVHAAAEATAKEVSGDDDDMPVIRLSDRSRSAAWSVQREGDVFVVSGEKIEKFARRTNYDNFEGLNRLRDIMKKLGISHELRRQGAQGDSTIRINDNEFTFIEQ
jgi:GTP-binding protein